MRFCLQPFGSCARAPTPETSRNPPRLSERAAPRKPHPGASPRFAKDAKRATSEDVPADVTSGARGHSGHHGGHGGPSSRKKSTSSSGASR